MLPRNYVILSIISKVKNLEEEPRNKRQKLVSEGKRNSFLSFLEEIMYQRPNYDELFVKRKIQDLPKEEHVPVLVEVMGTEKLKLVSNSFQRAVESYQMKKK